jgi:uncharacterized protein (DUF2147 family)
MRVSGSELALRASGLAAALFGLGVSVAQAADPVGTWRVPNGDAIVRIADCASLQAAPSQPGTPGGTLCGVVVWLKEPIDPATGKLRVDSLNVDPAKRDQPILGMQGVFDMRPAKEPMQWEGRVYNIDDGKVYDGSIVMKSDNELYIQGCFMLLCQGEEWIRQDVPDPPKPSKPAPPQPARAR